MNVKLTDSNDRTRGGTQWGPGVLHRAPGTGDLCTDGWIHYYRDPMLAVMMDPVDGKFGENAHMWTVTVSGKRKHEPDKSGAQRVRTVERIDMPVVTRTQRQAFGILAAREVYGGWANYDTDGIWWSWSERWLSGEDRSKDSAITAQETAWAAAGAAAWAAAWAARESAWSEAWLKGEDRSTEAASAAWAAAEAAEANPKINLVEIAHKAMNKITEADNEKNPFAHPDSRNV